MFKKIKKGFGGGKSKKKDEATKASTSPPQQNLQDQITLESKRQQEEQEKLRQEEQAKKRAEEERLRAEQEATQRQLEQEALAAAEKRRLDEERCRLQEEAAAAAAAEAEKLKSKQQAAAAVAAALAKGPLPRAQPTPQPEPSPSPPPRPKHKVASAPVKPAAVFTAVATADSDKLSVNIAGGIPSPEENVSRSELSKDPNFSSEKPYHFIKDVLDLAPAGLFASMMEDMRDISSAHIDANIVEALQAEDQRKKGMYNRTIDHVLAAPLIQEITTHQSKKYGPKGVTCFRDLEVGERRNEIILRTHAELLDGHNSRTGSWSGRWSIIAQNSPGVAEATLTGEVTCRAWCYEDCTVHASCCQKFAAKRIQGDADIPLHKAINTQIVEWEKEVMEALSTVYDQEMDATLKQIRRTLPITRSRLRWDLVAERSLKARTSKK